MGLVVVDRKNVKGVGCLFDEVEADLDISKSRANQCEAPANSTIKSFWLLRLKDLSAPLVFMYALTCNCFYHT